MTPYLSAFLDELKRLEHNTESWTFVDGQNPTLTLAAKNSLVGPLVLYDDGDELTLEFGTKYHCHFDGFETEDCETSRMLAAAMLAADYVNRILRERIGVAVHFNDRGCIGASLIYLDDDGLSAENLAQSNAGIYGGMIRTERFLWTGPITNPT
jgi:hypothetical protein